jgi:hypothetical protein
LFVPGRLGNLADRQAAELGDNRAGTMEKKFDAKESSSSALQPREPGEFVPIRVEFWRPAN